VKGFLDFFKDLFRSRVTGSQVSAQAKVYGVQARAKSKVASGFNRTIDGSISKAKGAATPNRSKAGEAVPKKEEKKMGFWRFGKKKQEQPIESPPDAFDPSAKTQAISIKDLPQAQFKPCVGWVVIMNEPYKGRDFRLVPGKNRVGTDADMEVVLSDQSVSAHHCNIVFREEDSTYHLFDAGSNTGTKLNGKRVTATQLVDNDIIEVGQIRLRFKALF
jgi:hypothetical protein